jgi:hypothetical protein
MPALAFLKGLMRAHPDAYERTPSKSLEPLSFGINGEALTRIGDPGRFLSLPAAGNDGARNAGFGLRAELPFGRFDATSEFCLLNALDKTHFLHFLS